MRITHREDLSLSLQVFTQGLLNYRHGGVLPLQLPVQIVELKQLQHTRLLSYALHQCKVIIVDALELAVLGG